MTATFFQCKQTGVHLRAVLKPLLGNKTLIMTINQWYYWALADRISRNIVIAEQ